MTGFSRPIHFAKSNLFQKQKTLSEQKNSDLMEEKRNLMTGVMDGSQLRSPAIALIEKSFKAEKLINFSC